MTSIVQHRGSVSTVLSSELDSLADETNATSSEIDNGTDLYFRDDVELLTAMNGYALDAGATVELFLIEALDDTAFSDGDSTIDPPAMNIVGAFDLRAVTTAQRHIIRGIVIPPTKFKYVVINKTSQTWASSGNVIRRRSYKHKAG
jgi:hypothetical protein